MTKEIQLMVSVAILDRIFHELSIRAGFDHWWGEVDKETRKEITDELIKVIMEELDD